MDVKDKKLIYELSGNSRMPLNKLAKAINSSSSMTTYRIRRLFEDKIILGTYAIIDNSLLGFKGFRIYLKFTGTTTSKQDEIFNWLMEQKEVSVLNETTGFIDCSIISWAKKNIDFHNFVKRLKERYQDYISDLEISNYIKVHHFTRDYLLENNNINNKIITIGEREEIENHDEMDLKILIILSKNARKSSLEISKELKCQPKTVIERIRKLENRKIIKGYGINLDIEKFGYEYQKANIIFTKRINYNKLLSYVSTIKNSVYVDESTNQDDLELNMEVKNYKERDKIINSMRDVFGGLKEVRYFQIKRFMKLSYIPF